MERYIKCTSWFGHVTTKRMVNQPEIVDYITNNPGQTENQIMYFIYGYNRNTSMYSNKKYAECLRRALYKGSIRRENTIMNNRNTFIYFKTEPTKTFIEWLESNDA